MSHAAKSPSTPHIEELVVNRKAYHLYEIVDKLEVGIVLTGTEIKSVRANGASIQEAYVTVDKGQLWLINSSIAPYKFGSHYNHEEKRRRKLLAHKIEIRKLQSAMTEKGFTAVPLSLYLKNGILKVSVGLGKGKKQADKREALKEAEDKRSIARALKNSQ